MRALIRSHSEARRRDPQHQQAIPQERRRVRHREAVRQSLPPSLARKRTKTGPGTMEDTSPCNRAISRTYFEAMNELDDVDGKNFILEARDSAGAALANGAALVWQVGTTSTCLAANMCKQ